MTKRHPFMPSWRSLTVAALLALTLAAFGQKQGQPQQPVNLPPEQGAKQGRELVAEILSQKPIENSTNSGVMTIRRDNKSKKVPIRFSIVASPTNWLSIYDAGDTDLTVTHADAQTDQYRYHAPNGKVVPLTGNQTMFPFADSDFWMADLGLEFFHWPEQRLLRKEMNRSLFCNVLESINPQPAAGAYSRVVSWVDTESGGIVAAQAFDVSGKLLKEFFPKKVKKIGGQWQLQEMEIDNAQTDSRTVIDFDLAGK